MLKLIKPEIFPDDEVISGVTERNIDLFPPNGIFISKGDVYSDKEIVQMRQKFADYLKVDPKKMKYQIQTHSDTVAIVNSNSDITNSDGMVTNEAGLVLNVSIADCGAILIYARDKKIISAVHSGWKGTLQNITKNAVDILVKYFGIDVKNILAFISPCASAKNYEVGEEFKKYFKRNLLCENNKIYFDNRAEIADQLLECGVNSKNIEISTECTIENTHLHSYRRDKEQSGRMSAFIGIR